MSSDTLKGNGAIPNRLGLDDILLASLQQLAAADRAEAACRLAGQACAVLRQSNPAAWNRFNVMLHRLTKNASRNDEGAAST